MKRVIFTLLNMLAVSVLFGQGLVGVPQPLPGKSRPAPIVSSTTDRLEAVRSNQRAVNEIIVDYDIFEEIISIDSGWTYEANYGTRLNSKYNVNDQTINDEKLKWAVVRFDTLVNYDFDNGVFEGYPAVSSQTNLDTLVVWVSHENFTGNPDTVVISVYEYANSPSGIVVSQNEITNTVLWEEKIITDTSLSTNGGNILPLIMTPNLALAQGEKFAVGIHFYGDTLNEFYVIGGFTDRCFEACVAAPSAFDLNSLYYIIFWAQDQGGNWFDLNGVNSIGYDCDGNNQVEDETCELYFLQNLSVRAYLTVDTDFDAFPIASASEGCPGDDIALQSRASGGVGEMSYVWTPSAYFDAPFSANTNIELPDTSGPLTVTVQITDEDNNVITKNVTINVRGVKVNAGADQQIACGTTANLLATVTGYVNGTTVVWDNGPTTFANNNVGPGTYSVTATNNKGCTATDAVMVSYQNLTQVPNFTIQYSEKPTYACEGGDPVTFTNTSSNTTGWSWLWSFGDVSNTQSVAQNASFTYPNKGTFTVTLQADSGSCSLSVSKFVIVDICPGIEETALSAAIDVFPNPTKGMLNIQFNGLENEVNSITVYNMQGKEVYNNANVNGNAVETLDMTSQNNGIYLVKIQVGNQLAMKKIVLNR